MRTLNVPTCDYPPHSSVLHADCGIRPSTQQEAEWLQDYVRKSNNNKAQADAARASGKSGDEGGSDAEDDDESSEGGGGGGSVVGRVREQEAASHVGHHVGIYSGG